MGLTLRDLDLVDVAFIVELIEERNGDIDNDNVIEATPEIFDRFFK